MTAPAPLDLPALLDDLERAHAAATRGAWEHVVDDHGLRKGVEHSVWDDVANRYIVETLADADAALIVAAVNAAPTLIAELRKRDAALRAVTAEAERMAYPANEPWGHVTQAEHGERLLRILTAALSPESVQS